MIKGTDEDTENWTRLQNHYYTVNKSFTKLTTVCSIFQRLNFDESVRLVLCLN